MANISEFTSRIASRVDGCPDPTIEEAVLDTCIDFCEHTGILQTTLTLALTPNQDTATLPLAAGTRLVSLQHPAVDGQLLSMMAPEMLGTLHSQNTVGMPRRALDMGNGVLRLWPTPDAAYTLSVLAMIKPSRTATTVDDSLVEDWMDAIISGALSRLMAMPEPWGNVALSTSHGAAYVYLRDQAKLRAILGRGNAELRITPPRI